MGRRLAPQAPAIPASGRKSHARSKRNVSEHHQGQTTKVILNQDFTSGLTQPAKLLDYFPYLAPPPES
jgi:hypothetical protein